MDDKKKIKNKNYKKKQKKIKKKNLDNFYRACENKYVKYSNNVLAESI